MRTLLLSAVALCLTFQAPVSAQAPSSGAAGLSTGIRQVEEGDLEAATATLEGVVQRLRQEKGREKDVATAHLYLAMAHLGLSQWERAKGEMREAWRNNQGLALDPKKYPPRVIQLYDEAKREAQQAGVMAPKTPESSTPPAAPELAPKKKGGGAKLALIIGGLAVAGGGAALAAGGGGGGTTTTTPPLTPVAPPAIPRSVTATAAPEGTAIVDVTVVSFVATPANLTAPVFFWDFGDGTTGAGQTPTHTYHAEGSFTVTVNATGSEGSATASVIVRAGTTSGRWEQSPGTAYELVQEGNHVAGRWVSGDGIVDGTLRSPREVSLNENSRCRRTFVGVFNSTLTAMEGQHCAPYCPNDRGETCWTGTWGRVP